MIRVLVVDDEPSVLYTLTAIFKDEGHEVLSASNGEQALALLRTQAVDILITDLCMPGMDGMALLREARKRWPAMPVIMVTAQGNERLAVEAMKEGACDYLRKPFGVDEVLLAFSQATERFRLTQENLALRDQLALSRPIIYRSQAIARLLHVAHRVAPKPVTVLITGETGTGKELFAWAIHEWSGRSGAFVRVNVASIPRELAESELFGHEKGSFTGAAAPHRGLFERAQGGTLLLDEVGELAPELQVKLLRVLQEGEILPVGGTTPRKVDCRIVAATHRDLADEVAKGRFREDLYYRLNVVNLHVPPLRDRREDLPPLIHHFATAVGQRFGTPDLHVPTDVEAYLCTLPLPGNVRELQNLIERMVALSDGERLSVADALGDSAQQPSGFSAASLRERVELYEKRLIEEALQKNSGNHSATARELGLSRITLLDKMSKYGLR